MSNIIPDDSRFEVPLSEYGIIISRFLQRIDFHMPELYIESSIEPALAEYIEQQPWSASLKGRAVKYAKQAIGIASWYPRASFACRYNCVVITLLVIIYDEEYMSFGDAGADFSLRLIRGQPQKAPFLNSLAQ